MQRLTQPIFLLLNNYKFINTLKHKRKNIKQST